MKVKYIGANTYLRTKGRIYDAKDEEEGIISFIADDGCVHHWSIKDRFEVILENLIEEREKKIQEARKALEEQKQKVNLLEKELKDLINPPAKVGEVWETCGSHFLMMEVEGRFGLVKLPVPCNNGMNAGTIHNGKLCDTPEEAFAGHKQFFNKIN